MKPLQEIPLTNFELDLELLELPELPELNFDIDIEIPDIDLTIPRVSLDLISSDDS